MVYSSPEAVGCQRHDSDHQYSHSLEMSSFPYMLLSYLTTFKLLIDYILDREQNLICPVGFSCQMISSFIRHHMYIVRKPMG